MHRFLTDNRTELVARCMLKVEQRKARGATPQQLAQGVPLFLDQLTRTLVAEDDEDPARSMAISGPAGGDALALSEIGVSAAAHGKELLALGYTVDQVVHDYGDLCQAITDLAFERDAPFSVDQFRTLNRCLDNAIADAVTAFSLQRDVMLSAQHDEGERQRMGFLVHEVRNQLATANLAVRAIELGNMAISGATGAVLKRSLGAIDLLVTRATAELRGELANKHQLFSAAAFIAEAELEARLDPGLQGTVFEVSPVEPSLAVHGNRGLLGAALANLLQNAFKFTRPNSVVTLRAYALESHVHIDVEDHCGGLPTGSAARMFVPFRPNNHVRAGLGLGLSIARRSVEAEEGTLTVRDVPSSGCVFTIRLPLHQLA